MANTTESTPRAGTGTGKPKKTASKKSTAKAAAKPTDEKSPTTKKAVSAKNTPSASKKAASDSTANKPKDQAARPITSEERHRLIAQAAYIRAEKRGFLNGDPEQDWLEAEREIDAALTMGKGRARKG